MPIRSVLRAALWLCCVPALVLPASAQTLPLTTSSAAARASYERGMVLVENLRMDEALAAFRRAARQDPNFALAQLFISYTTKDPGEDAAARAKARSLAAKASPGEKLMVEWLAGAREGDYVAAIAAMNDLAAQYPRDKRVLFFAARWLGLQEQYGAAQKFIERALAIDPNYAAVLNQAGYAYANSRDFDKAFAAMERYVKLLPREPNPRDSFGEISRMGGRFQKALEHYQAALKLDSKFFTSQLGLADTYSLMGEQEKARAEYNRAATLSESPADQVDATLQWAATYVREKKFAEADRAFAVAADKAHRAGLGRHEAQAHRMMAMYQEKPEDALRHLQAAEAALNEKHDIAPSDREEEMARILRWKAAPSMLALKEGAQVTADALAGLEKMAAGSRNIVVQRSYHGAHGTMLAHRRKCAEAIPHLEEDNTSPFSALVLLSCYSAVGQKDDALAVQRRLIGWNEPTLEQALVVPGFRAELARLKE